MHLTVVHRFLPKKRTLNTSLVMSHFGIAFDQGDHVIARDLELRLNPGEVVLFTGPSGSGKSSLLRETARQLSGSGSLVQSIDALDLPDLPLVDALPLPILRWLELLSACGLSEAQLLLRTPGELSDGQRYRFRLALAIGQVEFRGLAVQPAANSSSQDIARDAPPPGRWLVADEFTATLDRTLARVLAFNLRKLAGRLGIGFLLATTHEDILDDLDPDVVVRCDLDGRIEVSRRDSAPGAPLSPGIGGFPGKNALQDIAHDARGPSARDVRPAARRRVVSFFASSGSAKVPRPTGRTSLAGTTAATTWPWSSG